ncbi:MAG: nitrilase-related carbon-nitrogen hydrolase [Christensenellaceae bacterium]
MRNVKVAACQFSCSENRNENLEKAVGSVKEAAKLGAQIILLPELFERRYFCQERRYEYYDYAETVSENLAVKTFLKLSDELKAAIPVSFYEKDGNVLYNSVAMTDCGKLLGVYRKTHIPDDHYYQEKFYFTPGNTGFVVFDTSFCKVGVGICWDQWFPETARGLANNGAEILLYPTAIGSEPILGTDSKGHWQRVMQGHAAANLMPVVAANRFGTEKVFPCRENGGQSSELNFYGSSFITDNTGKILKEASCDSQEIICCDFDFDALYRERLGWGLFRDRREEVYGNKK